MVVRKNVKVDGQSTAKASDAPGFSIGKVEKYDIAVQVNSVNGQVRAKLLNLAVGEGFIVQGVERDRVTSGFPKIFKETGKRFKTHRLELMTYRVVRVK